MKMSHNKKTSLDRKINTTQEMIKKWNRLINLYVKAKKDGRCTSSSETESSELITWMQRSYPIISTDMNQVTQMGYYDPLLGIRIKNLDPILNLIMQISFISELFSHRLRSEFEGYLRSGRGRLNYYLGYLENKKASIGEIDVREYEMLKVFYENNIKENKRFSQRGELMSKLVGNFKKFETAEEYFNEAKSCFEYGYFRSAVIIAVSALESCLKTDYRRNKEIRAKRQRGGWISYRSEVGTLSASTGQ